MWIGHLDRICCRSHSCRSMVYHQSCKFKSTRLFQSSKQYQEKTHLPRGHETAKIQEWKKHEQKESAQNRLLLEFREQSNQHRRERKEIEYIFEPNANVPTVNRLTNKLNNQIRLERERTEMASDRRLRTVTMAMWLIKRGEGVSSLSLERYLFSPASSQIDVY